MNRVLTQIHCLFPAAAPSLNRGTEELNMQLTPESFIAVSDLFIFIRSNSYEYYSLPEKAPSLRSNR
jgi:hypothetical protein